MDVLIPANYLEFMRVLKEDGILVKIVPGERYLHELRRAASKQLIHKEYSNEEVIKYFSEHIGLYERIPITYNLSVNQQELEHFFKMTPLMFGVDINKIENSNIESITIDMEILVGKKKKY